MPFVNMSHKADGKLFFYVCKIRNKQNLVNFVKLTIHIGTY